MNKEEHIYFLQRLAFLLEAGIALAEAFDILVEQSGKKNRAAFVSLALDISRGRPFSEGAAEHLRWEAFAIELIRLGEMSGSLAENLSKLATELKKRRELVKKLQGMLVYPTVISLLAFAVALLMIFYIFPKIVPIFKSINMPLPFMTRLVLGLTDISATSWIAVFLGLGASIGTLLVLYKKYPPLRYFFFKLLHRLPIVSSVVKSYVLAQISRVLGTLLKGTMPIDVAFGMLSETILHPIYREEIHLIKMLLGRGGKMSSRLVLRPDLFPPIFTQMVATAEMTGNLGDVFLYLSRLYESEVDDLTRHFSNAVEPVIMILMGLAVGCIAIAVISPIYAITQHIHH